jgi:hypothetical protein
LRTFRCAAKAQRKTENVILLLNQPPLTKPFRQPRDNQRTSTPALNQYIEPICLEQIGLETEEEPK